MKGIEVGFIDGTAEIFEGSCWSVTYGEPLIDILDDKNNLLACIQATQIKYIKYDD